MRNRNSLFRPECQKAALDTELRFVGRTILLLLMVLSLIASMAMPVYAAQPAEAQAVQTWKENRLDFSGSRTEPESHSEPEKEELNHAHHWHDGYCVICGARCNHISHNAETRRCDVCGKTCRHIFEKGECRICGQKWVQLEDFPPEWVYEECEEKGETIPYALPVPALGSSAVKYMEVYLPYGYDESQQYDVLLLYCGLKIPYNSFTTDVKIEGRLQTRDTITMCNLYDNMIREGLCKPMIIVSISSYTMNSSRGWSADYNENDSYKEGALDKFWDTSLVTRESIFPYIIDNYSTYARSSAPEDIRAARRHFAIGGFSNGGYFSFCGGMGELYDYCSAFVPMAGSILGSTVGKTLYENGEQYPIDLAYVICGKTDPWAYTKTIQDYTDLRDTCPGYLVEGENLLWGEPEYAHDWATGSIGLYNSMQLLFTWNDEIQKQPITSARDMKHAANLDEKRIYDDWVWVGDSRTVGMAAVTPITTIAEVGVGIGFLREHIEEITQLRGKNIVFNLGVNDLENVKEYLKLLNSRPPKFLKENNLIVLSVNPCAGIYSELNEQIDQFNTLMENNLEPSILWIDSNSWMLENGFATHDGLHYDDDTYWNLYCYVLAAAAEKFAG